MSSTALGAKFGMLKLWRNCSNMDESLPAPVAILLIEWWGHAVACSIAASCLGPAVGLSGTAKSQVGGGLVANLWSIWERKIAPPMLLKLLAKPDRSP